MKHTTRYETRTVPVERGGKTHMVSKEFAVSVPRPPRDWDAIALRAVSAAAALAVAGAVTWSTVAIGGLLSGMAPEWAAYTVSGVFDLAWIICMTLEWLSRYDRGRAVLPIACGWVALGVSVGLIALHGHMGGSLVLGVCGGAVSVLAKGMWTVVMRHSAVEMDEDSRARLEAERASVNSRLAVTAARRQLTRTESRTAAEALALSAGQPDTWTVVPDRTAGQRDSGQDSLSVLGHDNERVSLSVLSAVPDNRAGQPDSPAAPGQDSGQSSDRTEDSRTVPLSRDRTGQDSPAVPDNRTASVSGALSQRAFVRGLLSADPGLSDTDLSAAVRSEYGQDTKADSIRKAIQRARGDLSRTA